MIFHPARLATEKAVFRPALPTCSLPGISEMQMAKSTYFEKLRDPRWQRKRLEVMQRDEFTCRACFDKDSTLNVHHRAYVKGNEPWDYPLDSLVTLCESCHSNEAQISEAIHDFLIRVWPRYRASTDTTRFENLGYCIASGTRYGEISPYQEEAWMACIGAISLLFSTEPEPEKIPVISQLLELFEMLQKEEKKESQE